MILIDLFAGIGGFHLGLERAGFDFTKVYYSENNKHAIACYKRNFPDAKYAGAIESIRAGRLPKPYIITLGSPCQGFSQAGRGLGLGDPRSGLLGQGLSLIDALRPPVFIWENVRGTITRKHRKDFFAVLQTITHMGYDCEWQLLDTHWLLPQHRERIYVIGHLRGASRPKIFPFRENEPEFTQKANFQPQTQHRAAATTLGVKTDRASDTFVATQHCSTLTTGGNSGGLHSEATYIAQMGRGFNKGGLHKYFPTITSQRWEQHHYVVDARCFDRPPRVTKHIPTISANFGVGGHNVFYYTDGYQIRRLTEKECERAQGFPDDFTKYGNYDTRTKEIAMTNRYKMIGNAVSPPIVTMIGRRLRA